MNADVLESIVKPKHFFPKLVAPRGLQRGPQQPPNMSARFTSSPSVWANAETTSKRHSPAAVPHLALCYSPAKVNYSGPSKGNRPSARYLKVRESGIPVRPHEKINTPINQCAAKLHTKLSCGLWGLMVKLMSWKIAADHWGENWHLHHPVWRDAHVTGLITLTINKSKCI